MLAIEQTLRSKTVPQLHKEARSLGVPYSTYSRMKKDELVTHILSQEDYEREAAEELPEDDYVMTPMSLIGDDPAPPKDRENGDEGAVTSSEIEKQVEEFLNRGGRITELPGPQDPKHKISSMKQALKPVAGPARKTRSKKQNPVTSVEVQGEEESAPVSLGDMVELSTLLGRYRLKGTVARKALRKSEIEKPGSRWMWKKGSSELARVESILKAAKDGNK